MKILAIIPARSGSKSIPHKNLAAYAGKPLLVHAIEQSLSCPEIDQTLVSTDSPEYAELARSHGAAAPFLRPHSISTDTATDIQVFQHALSWLEAELRQTPDILVHLRPTSPRRAVSDISAMIRKILADPTLDSVRAVTPAPHTPYKMWRIDAEGLLSPLLIDQGTETWNMPRQALPEVYLQTASIDVVRSRTIKRMNSMTGQRIGSHVISEFGDVDTHNDLHLLDAEAFMANLKQSAKLGPLRLVVDIDGVIASIVDSGDYSQAYPLAQNIEMLRQLATRGHYLILFTARGDKFGKNWEDLTKTQMADWDVPFNEIRFGKPHADVYIDDKVSSASQLRQLVNTI